MMFLAFFEKGGTQFLEADIATNVASTRYPITISKHPKFFT